LLAQKYLETSYKMYTQLSLNNDVGFAKTAAFLGNIYRKRGDYKKALSCLTESLEIYNKHWGNNHFRVGWILIHLGNLEVALGNAKKSRDLFDKGIAIFKLYNPETHTDVAWATVHASESYRLSGDYVKAKEMLESSINIYKSSGFSDYQLGIGRAYFFLGNVYNNEGNYIKAKFYLKKALSSFEYGYGKDNIETARIIERLGHNYLMQERIDLAEPLLNKAYKIFKSVKHPDMYLVLEDLSEMSLKKSVIALKNGKYSVASELQNKSLKYLQEALKIVNAHFYNLDNLHSVRIKTKIQKLKELTYQDTKIIKLL
jgi:tetratricopeptide (TPR) repeat protein